MKKISVSLSGHQTSITLEPEFIIVLKRIANARGVSIASIISEIDNTRNANTNLSSAIRVWVLDQVTKN